MTLADRLWRRTYRTDSGCLIFTGAKSGGGYGVLGRGLDSEGNIQAHRAAWELTFGPIPEGMFVCHHCDIPPCVEPSHLFLGSSKDNTQDAKRKGRLAVGNRHGTHTHPDSRTRGSRNGWNINRTNYPIGQVRTQAKLTDEDVREIRGLKQSGWDNAALGRRFGVARETIRQIFDGRTWTHIQ